MPKLTTRTGPSDVVATPRAPPYVVAVLGLVALGAAVGVDVVLPHADASRTAAVAANIRTVNADLVMAPPGGFTDDT